MRITKQIAQSVAQKLVQTKRDEIEQLRTKQAEFITDIYEVSLSDLIKSAFKKHKGFIHYSNSIRLSGAGLSQGYKNYPLSYELPICNSCGQFPVSDKQAANILAFENEIDKKTTEMRELFKSIEVALLSLRTYANIEREFPEASAHLPKTQTTAIVVNLKDIRCKLDKANC